MAEGDNLQQRNAPIQRFAVRDVLAERALNTPFRATFDRPIFTQYEIELDTNGGGFGGTDAIVALRIGPDATTSLAALGTWRLQLNSGGLTWIETRSLNVIVPPGMFARISCVTVGGTPATFVLNEAKEITL